MGSVMSWVIVSVRVVLVVGIAVLVSRIVYRWVPVTRPAELFSTGTGSLSGPALTVVPPMEDPAGIADPAASAPGGGSDAVATAPTTVEQNPGSEQAEVLAAVTVSPAQAVSQVSDDAVVVAVVGAPVPLGVPGPDAPSPSPNPAPGKRSDLAAIRAWAREHGYIVADRGRIAAAVITAYDESR